jgi:hypothetical protein
MHRTLISRNASKALKLPDLKPFVGEVFPGRHISGSASVLVQPIDGLSSVAKHLHGPVRRSERAQQAGEDYGLLGRAHHRKGSDSALLVIRPDLGTHPQQLIARHRGLHRSAIEQFSVGQSLCAC